MKPNLRGIATATALMTALVLGIGGAAEAATTTQTTVTPVPGTDSVYKYEGGDFGAQAYNDCGGGTCFFSEFDGGGYLWIVPSCGRHNVPTWFNDLATSAWNRTSVTVNIFQDSNQRGYLGPMPGWFKGNLYIGHNNKMSSVDSLC
ncbi:peptidase inhibitor family I36 protein [Kitasatospora sp. NPDC056184]|uniref:peptidase inhibitor family I36 protein n=1 Tax=Kitasatospora sp. NPDC056184 TaxID=3345738 RepID=UPI0035D64891